MRKGVYGDTLSWRCPWDLGEGRGARLTLWEKRELFAVFWGLTVSGERWLLTGKLRRDPQHLRGERPA